MKRMIIQRLILFGIAVSIGFVLGLTSPVSAGYPEKPIKVIVPYGAGGLSDTIARMVVNTINEKKLLPQPVVVVNVVGGAGAIGFQRVKDAKPDGYEVLSSHIGLLVSGAIGRTDFGPEAFDVYAQAGTIELIYAAKSDSKYKTFPDFVKAAKAAPGEIPEASSIGGSVHLASLTLSKAADYTIRIVHVGGGAKRIKSILGDHTAGSFFSTVEYKNYKESGIQGLVMLSNERDPLFPDIPTAKELGYEAQMAIDVWYFAPKNTPKDRIAILEGAWEKAMNDTGLQEKLKERGLAPKFMKGDALTQYVLSTYKKVQSFAPQLVKKKQ